jgi:phosphatidylglycerophosphate synthase
MCDCKQNADVSANIYGKLKTVLQMWAIIFIFFICCFTNEDNTHNKMWWFGQNLLMYAATIMSIFSGSYYLFVKNIHDDHKN